MNDYIVGFIVKVFLVGAAAALLLEHVGTYVVRHLRVGWL